MAIKVLIVDDSAMVRQLLTEMISADPAFVVVGSASDPLIARDRIKQLKPDVLTLDVEMPRMDGLTFLENLMRLHPLPVLMVSSLTERGAEVTLQALELGAVDFVTKPKIDVKSGLIANGDELRAKLKAVARARVFAKHQRPVVASTEAPAPKRRVFGTTEKIIAIASSTGGTEAVKEVLMQMPADAPAIAHLQQLVLEAVLVAPLEIHAQQHVRPVLPFGTAGAGLDIDITVRVVHLAREHALEFHVVGEPGEALDIGGNAGDGARVVLHLGEFEKLQRVFQARFGFFERLDHILELGALAAQTLGDFGLVPDVAALQLGIDFGQTVLLVSVVKDSPAARRNASAGLSPLLEFCGVP